MLARSPELLAQINEVTTFSYATGIYSAEYGAHVWYGKARDVNKAGFLTAKVANYTRTPHQRLAWPEPRHEPHRDQDIDKLSTCDLSKTFSSSATITRRRSKRVRTTAGPAVKHRVYARK